MIYDEMRHQLILALKNFKKEIIEAFDHRIGIAEKNILHRFELLIEGQQVLAKGRREVQMEKLVERMRGRATVRMSTDEIMALTRGEN